MPRPRLRPMAPDLQLLLQASGQPDIKQFALAHGLSEDTVRSWDKRGQVPPRKMWAFKVHYAKEIDALSAHQTVPPNAPFPLEEAGLPAREVRSSVASYDKGTADVAVVQLAERVAPWKLPLEAPPIGQAPPALPDRAPAGAGKDQPEPPKGVSSGGAISPTLTRAALLRDRGAGAVQPLLLSLPLGLEGGQSGDYELIPMHMRSASAGPGVVTKKDEPDQLNLAGQMAFSFEWLRRNLGHTTGQLTTIEVRGDSMSTTLLDGDTIMIDEGVDAIDVDGIYVLDMYGRRLVKRVQHLFDGTLVLISDNPCYQRENIPRDRARDVQVVGRMVWPRV